MRPDETTKVGDTKIAAMKEADKDENRDEQGCNLNDEQEQEQMEEGEDLFGEGCYPGYAGISREETCTPCQGQDGLSQEEAAEGRLEEGEGGRVAKGIHAPQKVIIFARA